MIKIKDKYKEKLKQILKKEWYDKLMSLLDDWDAFSLFFVELTVAYMTPDTNEPTKATYELEEIYEFIKYDN